MSSSSDKLIFYLAVVLFVCFVFCFVFLMARHFSKGECCSEKVGRAGSLHEDRWRKVGCGGAKPPRRHSLILMVLPVPLVPAHPSVPLWVTLFPFTGATPQSMCLCGPQRKLLSRPSP